MSAVQAAVGHALSELPEVFSTVQWGGRAYKLPGPGSRGMKRPLLVAHVCLSKAGDAVCVDFKLPRDRAAAVVKAHAWIVPHSFRTLAPSGWVSAEVRTLAQVKSLAKLLHESRAMYPVVERARARGTHASRKGQQRDHNHVLARLGEVVNRKKSEGWSPDRGE